LTLVWVLATVIDITIVYLPFRLAVKRVSLLGRASERLTRYADRIRGKSGLSLVFSITLLSLTTWTFVAAAVSALTGLGVKRAYAALVSASLLYYLLVLSATSGAVSVLHDLVIATMVTTLFLFVLSTGLARLAVKRRG